MNELREIIQEAWNKGEKLEKGADTFGAFLEGADTFGAFLDRAANAISEAGYRKEKPPIKMETKVCPRCSRLIALKEKECPECQSSLEHALILDLSPAWLGEGNNTMEAENGTKP